MGSKKEVFPHPPPPGAPDRMGACVCVLGWVGGSGSGWRRSHRSLKFRSCWTKARVPSKKRAHRDGARRRRRRRPRSRSELRARGEEEDLTEKRGTARAILYGGDGFEWNVRLTIRTTSTFFGLLGNKKRARSTMVSSRGIVPLLVLERSLFTWKSRYVRSQDAIRGREGLGFLSIPGFLTSFVNDSESHAWNSSFRPGSKKTE